MEIQVNNKVYYQAEEIVRTWPDLFREGKKKARQILQFKKPPIDHFIFASCVKSGWRISSESNNKAKLLLTKEWVDKYVESCKTKEEIEEENSQQTDEIEIREAPPILKLKDHEKFRDEKDHVLEIEVRGKREEESCFFRVKDISTCFGDLNLIDNIGKSHTSYNYKEDYVYFYRPYNIRSTDDKKGRQKELFFTYQGMLRYLFVSQNKNAKAFRRWASSILFAMQMGTTEHKENVVADLMGVSVETANRFMNACVRDMPLVYLLHLGEPPDSIPIPENKTQDDYLFLKIGGHCFDKEETKHGFQGRSKGHLKEFKEFRNQLSYLHFLFLDPMYVSEAERTIKDYLKEYHIEYENKSEVYLFPKSKLKEIKEFFKNLSRQFSGNATDIQRQFDFFKSTTKSRIEELERENEHVKQTLEIVKTQSNSLIGELKERIAEQSNFLKMIMSKFSLNV